MQVKQSSSVYRPQDVHKQATPVCDICRIRACLLCRWESMEVRFSSEQPDQGLELLEVFCNPNTYKTAFDAKLMITARSAGLKVVCEGRLSNLKADLDSFIKDHCD